MNKTLQVIHFEVMRNLKKPSFWAAAILVPVLLGAYIGIAALAGYQAGESLEGGTDTSEMKLAVYDEAEYLETTSFINENDEEQKIAKYEDKDSGINDVKSGKIDVFYYVPKNLNESQTIEVYTKQDQASLLDDYSTPIRSILGATATKNIDPFDLVIVTNQIHYNTTTYDAKDNHVIDLAENISKIIGPAVALVLFYILIVVLSNRIIAAMTEEKENRISELVLTSINPTNLIVGKIISLMILGIIQLIVLVLPLIILYKFAETHGALPFDIALQFDAFNIAQYAVLLIASYFLFTAFCVAIGAVSPTAKDANSFSSVIIILTILPLFFINALTGEPQAMAYFLTYFPPSAPITIMFRGVFGNLAPWEFWVGLADIVIVSALVAKLATHLFRRNAIDFTSKVSLKKLFGSPRTTWKN